LRVGKSVVDSADGKTSEVFTLTLDSETIELLPHRNWGQLDSYKWRARGKLPGTPAGLEITPDHVKISGETVSIADPEGAAKLEKLLLEWVALENETQALARQKAQPKAAPKEVDSSRTEPQRLQYHVDVDKAGHVHIRCVQGKETLALIGLNQRGFESLISQGLLKKPHQMKVGALHDWLELDGALFSFEHGNNDAGVLETALNQKYIPEVALGQGKDVVIYANPASSTGFDIQFPVRAGGVIENRRRSFGEETLELLQDVDRCGILQRGLVIKLARPHLIFKQRVADGGERYLEKNTDNCVVLMDDDGVEKLVDLSQPVNYTRLTPVELTAVFNHPAIHKHSKAAPRSPAPAKAAVAIPAPSSSRPGLSEPRAHAVPSGPPVTAPTPAPRPASPPEAVPAPPEPVIQSEEEPFASNLSSLPLPVSSEPLPNAWMEPILLRQSIRYDWFSRLVYGKVVERFGNSQEGRIGLSHCWAVALGEAEDLDDPTFTGIFLTKKHGIGYINGEHIARFNKGVALLGTSESAIEGIEVNLVAVALDTTQQPVFIVGEGYRSRFGVPEQAVEKELERLRECGAWVLSVSEVLSSDRQMEVVWTVPAEQGDPSNPQAVESYPPGEPGAGI
jgi:hypothetical protein